MLPWMPQVSAPAAADAHVVQGALCVDVTSVGAHPWDVQVRHRHMTIRKGHTYGVRFKIGATAATQVNVKVAMSGPPYLSYWRQELHVGPAPQVVTGQFTMGAADDATAEMAVRARSNEVGRRPALHRVRGRRRPRGPRLHAGPPKATPAPVPAVLVNQKWGTSRRSRRSPSSAATRRPRSRGSSTTRPARPTARLRVHDRAAARAGRRVGRSRAHWADFSSWTTPGRSLFSVHVGSDARPAVRRGPVALRQAARRRARLLLPEPQRRPDRDALRGRSKVDTPGRPRERPERPDARPTRGATTRWT